MNKWLGIGNLGADPVLRTTESGRTVVNMSIAVDRRYYTGEGATRQLIRETDWVPVVAWARLAETCALHLTRGSKVLVEGTLRPRSYTDRNNVKHGTFEITASVVTFLSRTRDSNEQTEEDVSAEVSMQEPLIASPNPLF